MGVNRKIYKTYFFGLDEYFHRIFIDYRRKFKIFSMDFIF